MNRDVALRKEFLRWGKVVRLHIRFLWLVVLITLVLAVVK